MNILSVTSLTKKYKDTAAVTNVDFTLPDGRCIALIGPNGAGKTTILRILAGILKPTTGEIQFSDSPPNIDIRTFIGYLPQYPTFPGWMTAKEFLIFSGELAGLSKKEATTRGEQLAKKVGLEDALDRGISGFSGGMKQRLGIAQAIIHSPKLLLLDEPVSSLDPLGRREVLTLLDELKKEMTILFSTHILNDAEEVCDELLLLNKGEIVLSGSMTDLREKYQTSVIELEFQGGVEPFLTKIQAFPSVSDCSIDRQTLKVVATDISVARKGILQTAADEDWPIVRFNIDRASLEELFMKAVKQ